MNEIAIVFIIQQLFRKLKDKTQVFMFEKGDYYRNRLTHTLEVSQIARSVSRKFQLNEDLAEYVFPYVMI